MPDAMQQGLQKSMSFAPTKPPGSKELQAADDFERKLRIAAELMEKMSAAGFLCELRHSVMLQ
jgi:hypothetical protein